MALSILLAGAAWATPGNGNGGGNGGGNSGSNDHGNGGGWGNVPEIDGGLAIQMITLVGGVLYILKRKK